MAALLAKSPWGLVLLLICRWNVGLLIAAFWI
jgi:hypothetical protein